MESKRKTNIEIHCRVWLNLTWDSSRCTVSFSWDIVVCRCEELVGLELLKLPLWLLFTTISPLSPSTKKSTSIGHHHTPKFKFVFNYHLHHCYWWSQSSHLLGTSISSGAVPRPCCLLWYFSKCEQSRLH